MRTVQTLATLLIFASLSAFAAEPCQTIRGRAIYYSADGQLRLWHIGTHHEFDPPGPDVDPSDSWQPIIQRLRQGSGTDTEAFDRNALVGDFVVCPTEPYRKSAVQPAIIRSMSHLRLVPR